MGKKVPNFLLKSLYVCVSATVYVHLFLCMCLKLKEGCGTAPQIL